MLRLHLLIVVLLASSCGSGEHKQVVQAEEQPRLAIAAQSVSLEFPLQFGAGDAPRGYIKVGSDEGRGRGSEHLIDALVLCSPGLAWVEKTSHSTAIIMPSDENAVWRGVRGWRPSDEDIIACVKQNINEPFFYRKLTTGTETYRQN